jgi:hypothetical protein
MSESILGFVGHAVSGDYSTYHYVIKVATENM